MSGWAGEPISLTNKRKLVCAHGHVADGLSFGFKIRGVLVCMECLENLLSPYRLVEVKPEVKP